MSNPLDSLLKEIERAAHQKLFMVAVGMALILPDICAQLELECGETKGENYKAWCDKNIGIVMSKITSDQIWSLRCKMLHQGRVNNLRKGKFAELYFFIEDNIIFSDSELNIDGKDIYLYSASNFCDAMIKAVRKWLKDNYENKIVENNLQDLMQYKDAPSLFGQVGGRPLQMLG